MKLVSYGARGWERPGVLLEDGAILDLESATMGRITTIRALLETGKKGLSLVADLLRTPQAERHRVPAETQRLGPPLTNPGKIVALGLNYRSHAQEQNVRLPRKPLLFSKSTTSLSGNGDPIWYPRDETRLDYEVELAFVIGRPAIGVDPAEWKDYVAGYTVINDVSARDAQFSDRKWFRGKSYDSFCPMGPFLVTSDEIPDPHSLRVAATVNDQPRQNSNTDDLIFGIPEILAFVSRNITLLPGDVIATGTPGGVGIFWDPPRCLEPGDTVTVTVEGIGSLTNQVSTRDVLEPSPYPHPRG